MTGYKQEFLTLGIAQAGYYATSPNAWGEMPCSIQGYDRKLAPYLGELVEGGLVVDKRLVLIDVLIDGVVAGPMLNESLPPKTYRRMGEEIKVPIMGEDGEYRREDGAKFSGFDYISRDVYLAYWRKRGALIGRRRGDVIKWESGITTPIAPFEQREQAKDNWLPIELRRG